MILMSQAEYNLYIQGGQLMAELGKERTENAKLREEQLKRNRKRKAVKS